MQIYRSIAICLLLSGICGNIYSTNASISAFVKARGGDQNQIALASPDHQYKGCFSTQAYLICLDSRIYPGISNNAQSRFVVLQNLNTTIKHMVYNYAIDKNIAFNFGNQDLVKKTVFNINHTLAGIEFLSGSIGDWAAAVSAIKQDEAKKELDGVYNKYEFKDNYGKVSLPVAKRHMEDGEYQKAISIFKELHDLKYINAETYILAGIAFIKIGERNEAKKLAVEVWERMQSQLDSDNAEQLGDLFQKLGEEKYAIAAYELASRFLLDHNN